MIKGDWREELTQGRWGIRGECLIDEPLDGLNSWRVGGPADLLVRPLDVEDVHIHLLRFLLYTLTKLECFFVLIH